MANSDRCFHPYVTRSVIELILKNYMKNKLEYLIRVIIVAVFLFVIYETLIKNERYAINSECSGLMYITGPRGEFKHGDSAYFHSGFFEPSISSTPSECPVIIQ